MAPIDNNIKLRFNVSLQRASGFEWATTTDAWCTPTGWSLDYSSPIMNGETPPPYLYPTAHGEICEGYSWSKEAGVLSVPFRSISGNLTVRAEDSHSLVYNSCRWTDDAAKPGEYSAVLTFRCSGCNEVVERNATVTHETLIAPTCTATGTERYYARYDGTIHDIKDVKGIPPKGHRYGNPTWAWNEIDEEKGVMLTLTCSVCNENESGYQTVLWVEPTFEVTLTPTCSTLGQGHYTASYSGAEGAYSGSHWVSIDYAPHNWDKSKWAYDENYHMHRCKDCHSVTDKAGHSYQNGSCTVCGVAEGTTFFTVKLFYDDSATPLRTEQLVRESVFTLPTYDNLSIPEDATFTPPAGKRLSGWKVVNGDIYNATAVNTQNFSQDEISLEAIWVDWEEFKVMLHSNNGGSLEESTTVKYGDKFTLPSCPFNPPEENMRFARWARNANGEGPISANELTIKANTDIYAIWENIPTHTVNFDSNGGDGTMNKATVYEGDWYDIPACEFNAPDNMRFDYWAYDEEGNDPANVSPICITDNITLFAIWENIPDLLISFNSNSGSGEMEEINLPYSVASAGGYALPPCSFTPPARSVFAGWSFTGGTTAGKVMAPDECITITSNTTLYAVWQALSDVTISFDKNNSDATGEMSPRHVPFDVEISLPICNFGAPYGYQFAGWSLTSDGLILETEKLLANENITLYAIWETIPTPTIYFNPNGGAGAMSPVKVASYGTDYIVPKSSDYHYDGHFFVGYSLTPNGSLVTTLENVEKNITLYTIWTDKENPDIIEGNKQRVIKGGTAQFVSDAPFLWFLGVMVDDVALTEPEDFTAAEGSTKITLTKEFTNELSFGKHTIEIHSVSGVAKGTFTIVSPNENITPIDNGERDKKTGEGISTDEPPKAEPKKAPATKGEDNEIDENPVTGGSNAPSGGAPQSGAPQSPTEGDKGAPTTESGGEPKAEGDSLSPDYTPDNKPEIITEPEPLPTKPIKGESEVNPIIWVVAVIAVSAFVLFLIFRRKKSKK